MTVRSALLAAFVLAAPAAAADSAIEYPTGYRAWPHVKSMLIHSEKHPLFGSFAGLHHVYVNARGEEAMKQGGEFPDGSVIVFDLLTATEENGAYVEGARKFVGVMVKDRKRFASTGGWGFEGFKGDSTTERMVTDANGQCFGCHQSQQKRDYVFSSWRR